MTGSISFGIRSGDREEFRWAREGHVKMHKFNLDGLAEVIEKLQGKPVYITLDLGCAGSVCISGNRNSGGGRCHICGTDECCDPDSTGESTWSDVM